MKTSFLFWSCSFSMEDTEEEEEDMEAMEAGE